ncbi:hypothetical protein EHS25_000940 [Saitozyma podzolica]|uniref:Major facilitator superfamily (MFS) profile domain-containing protein n=1 Tax=Saitozyma podzolica TaxID=1890683 RepID=A0A427YXN3_9TREE|nr:hypothetical protein EHS25_000940 [Saitozyma podzolica]
MSTDVTPALENQIDVVASVESQKTLGEQVVSEKWDVTREQANRAEQYEHSLSFLQAARLYKEATFWAIIASLSIVMEGFDKSFQGAVISEATYRKKFGQWYPELQQYQLTAAWQGAITQAPSVGTIIGIYVGGVLNDRFGYKKTLLGMTKIRHPLHRSCSALLVFAQNKAMLVSGGVLVGIPWGCFATLAEAYASEIAPLSLRGFLTGWMNVCWILGELALGSILALSALVATWGIRSGCQLMDYAGSFIGTGVTTGAQKLSSDWSWRLPYATQWIWPVPLIIFMSFAPESPWWLVRQGNLDEAEKSVRRLASVEMRDKAKDTKLQVRTTRWNLNCQHPKGPSRWRDLFCGTNLRRTEITVLAWLFQDACGNILTNNAIYVFEQAGIDQSTAFKLGLGTSGLQLVANFGNFYLMYLMGRRTLYMMGFAILDVNLMLVGIMAVFGVGGRNEGWAKWAQASFQMIFNIGYTGLLGPVCYAIIGETSSTRLRNKSISLGRIV